MNSEYHRFHGVKGLCFSVSQVNSERSTGKVASQIFYGKTRSLTWRARLRVKNEKRTGKRGRSAWYRKRLDHAVYVPRFRLSQGFVDITMCSSADVPRERRGEETERWEEETECYLSVSNKSFGQDTTYLYISRYIYLGLLQKSHQLIPFPSLPFLFLSSTSPTLLSHQQVSHIRCCIRISQDGPLHHSLLWPRPRHGSRKWFSPSCHCGPCYCCWLCCCCSQHRTCCCCWRWTFLLRQVGRRHHCQPRYRPHSGTGCSGFQGHVQRDCLGWSSEKMGCCGRV